MCFFSKSCDRLPKSRYRLSNFDRLDCFGLASLVLTGKCPNIFGVFRVQEGHKFCNFLANLVEFRVEKGLFCLYRSITFRHSLVNSILIGRLCFSHIDYNLFSFLLSSWNTNYKRCKCNQLVQNEMVEMIINKYVVYIEFKLNQRC